MRSPLRSRSYTRLASRLTPAKILGNRRLTSPKTRGNTAERGASDRLGRLAQLAQSVIYLSADSLVCGTVRLTLALDLDVDLGSKYWDVVRSVDADPHLLAHD